MKDDRKILAMIAARAGSKGIKNKNIQNLADRPLISYSILPAVKSKYIDRVIVTTDSQDIAEIAQSYGADVPFLRPQDDATDTADLKTVYFNCLRHLYEKENYEAEIIVYLMPTYPFKTNRDIDYLIEDILLRRYESSMFAHLIQDTEAMSSCCVDDEGFISPLGIDSTNLKFSWYMTNNSVFVRTMPPWQYIHHIKDPDERDLAMSIHFLEQSQKGITNGKTTIHNIDRIRGIDIDTPYELNLAEMVVRYGLFDFNGIFYE